MTKEIIKIYGGPGTGKTTQLLNYLDTVLEQYSPSEIVYITFTRAAASEVRERIRAKYPYVDLKELYVSTQHSIAYRLLGLSPGNVDAQGELRERICKLYNIPYSKTRQHDIEFDFGDEPGNKIFALYDFMRSKQISINPTQINIVKNSGSFSDVSYSVTLLHEIYNKYEKLKEEEGRVDYIDMLKKILERKLIPRNLKVIFADEFQDFGPLQYEVFKLWEAYAERSYIAGDDDQSIYSFLGANPEIMLRHNGKEEILRRNYRNYENVYSYALDLIRQNKKRKSKNIITQNNGGIVEIKYTSELENTFLNDEGDKIFMLARTNYFVNIIAQWLEYRNVPYYRLNGGSPWSEKFKHIWNAYIDIINNNPIRFEDAQVLLSSLPTSLMKRGEIKRIKELEKGPDLTYEEWRNKLFRINKQDVTYVELPEYLTSKRKGITKKQKKILENAFIPNMRKIDKIRYTIGTMHSAKGLECDTVYLFDAIPHKVKKSLSDDTVQEEERRVCYVALTRARRKVVIIKGFFNSDNYTYAEYLDEC